MSRPAFADSHVEACRCIWCASDPDKNRACGAPHPLRGQALRAPSRAHRRPRQRCPRMAGRVVIRPALYLAAALAIIAGLRALIDTHRGPDWDDYRDQLKERL